MGSALYLQNKDNNKIAMARRESKEECLAEGKYEKAVENAKNFLKMGLSIVIAMLSNDSCTSSQWYWFKY